MPTQKLLTFEQMDNIVFLREKGLNGAEAASICGVSQQSVSRVYAAYIAARDGNNEELDAIRKNYKRLADWACLKFNIKSAPELAPQQKNDNTAQAVVALLNCINDLTAAIERIDNRLSAMQMTQQGIRGELGEHTKKLVETINVNGDILTKEHERMIDLLGGIKMNTRRRGNNDAT